ncbi:39S ribosomal protein L34, mitochondrial isoform X1 [Lates calcarifer]|uniref:Large ribosomal subunit protein bL34m n=1 Tax=Lates calcarifer TaxID=8187 RepID=A0A4W6FD62_LATCA|nr:39S ribosomal protein L34, mitochondrial isoform X1 [Lates calcarifer]
MNTILSSFSRLRGITHFSSSIPTGNFATTGISHLRLFSSWIVPRAVAGPQISRCGPLSSAEGSAVFQQLPWQYQQVRTRKRGTEYQPKNIKRKRTHGWIKRISSQGGIQVILRRMLKGRKSLSH